MTRLGLVHNEFAAVAVSVDHDALGPRLRLEDRRGDRVAFLDPLELEALVWAPAGALDTLLDPGPRWREQPEEPG
jgi:hypothetical protein